MKVNLGKYNKDDSRHIDVQIEKFDTYSFDHTLAHIILPGLIQLKLHKMGVPTEFADVGGADYENQKSFDFYAETHDWAFEQSINKWEEILDKIIWSFQQILFDDWEKKYEYGIPEFDWVPSDQTYLNALTNKVEQTFTLLDKNKEDHWTDYNGIREHQRRIQEGLELFGKYYQHLWD